MLTFAVSCSCNVDNLDTLLSIVELVTFEVEFTSVAKEEFENIFDDVTSGDENTLLLILLFCWCCNTNFLDVCVVEDIEGVVEEEFVDPIWEDIEDEFECAKGLSKFEVFEGVIIESGDAISSWGLLFEDDKDVLNVQFRSEDEEDGIFWSSESCLVCRLFV